MTPERDLIKERSLGSWERTLHLTLETGYCYYVEVSPLYRIHRKPRL